jgi:hypothetical protein
MGPIRTFIDRHFDPSERLGEVLFGLIMVLTCTLGAGLVVEGDREATREMLLAAVGGNIAWGLINGMMYVLNRMFQRGQAAALIQAVREAGSEAEALVVIRGHIERKLEPFTSEEGRERLYSDILDRARKLEPQRTRLRWEDIAGALVPFWLVILSTVPAVVPFFFIRDRFLALRVSNLLLAAMLFLVGYRWASVTNTNPWLGGLVMTLIGLVLVGVAVALGG